MFLFPNLSPTVVNKGLGNCICTFACHIVTAFTVCFYVFVFLQAGQTALDQAREHNNPDVALLLTKAPQVKAVTPSVNSADAVNNTVSVLLLIIQRRIFICESFIRESLSAV